MLFSEISLYLFVIPEGTIRHEILSNRKPEDSKSCSEELSSTSCFLLLIMVSSYKLKLTEKVLLSVHPFPLRVQQVELKTHRVFPIEMGQANYNKPCLYIRQSLKSKQLPKLHKIIKYFIKRPAVLF